MTQLSEYAKRRARAKNVWLPEGWTTEPHLLSTLQIMHLTNFFFFFLRQLINAVKFPKPKKLSARRNAWNSVEVANWIEEAHSDSSKLIEEMEGRL